MVDLLDELLAAVGIKNEELKRTSDTIAAAVGVQVQEQRIQEEQQTLADIKSRELKQAELLEAKKAQERTQAFATDLGTNPDAASYVMGALATDWRDAAIDAAAKNKELSRAASSKFLDDPIQFIKDQVLLESKEEEAKAANYRTAQSQQALTFAQSQTQQAAVTANALKQTVTEKSIQDTMEGMAAESAAKASAQRVQNASINITGIEKLQSLSLAQLNNLSTAFSAAQQIRSFELSKGNLDLQRKSMELSIEERQERLDQKREDAAENANTVALARKGAAVLGYQNVMGMPETKILQMLKMKDPRVADWLMAGMKSEAIGYPVVSENAGESAKIIATSGAPLRPEQEQIKKFFGAIWQEGVNANPGAKADQIQAAVGKVAVQTAANQMKNIKTGDASNLYAPPPLPAVMALPAIQSSALYKNVFATQMQTGALKEFNPDQLVSMTVEGIKAGKISINDATEGLQGLFSGARSINNATKNYPGFGLPPQMGYMTHVDVGGFTRKYDLTQQQAVNQILNFNLSYKPGSLNPFAAQRNQAAEYNKLINPTGQ